MEDIAAKVAPRTLATSTYQIQQTYNCDISETFDEMAEQQKKLQSLSDEFQTLQTGMHQTLVRTPNFPLLIGIPDLQSIIEARQKLEAQEQENKAVQEVLWLSLCGMLTH